MTNPEDWERTMLMENNDINYLPDYFAGTNYKNCEGDTDPEMVADFAPVPRTWKDCLELDKRLDGEPVAYFIRTKEYPLSIEYGISGQVGTRLYKYGQYLKSIPNGKATFKIVRLTTAISEHKIEICGLFFAYVLGHQRDKNGERLRGECIRNSDDTVEDMVQFFLTLNKNKGFDERIDGSRRRLIINSNMCDGRNTGTPLYLGSDKGPGQYNIASFPQCRDFYENRRRCEHENRSEKIEYLGLQTSDDDDMMNSVEDDIQSSEDNEDSRIGSGDHDVDFGSKNDESDKMDEDHDSEDEEDEDMSMARLLLQFKNQDENNSADDSDDRVDGDNDLGDEEEDDDLSFGRDWRTSNFNR